MPSRRSHTKSHHGCAQCKARRVKCDEALPQCQRCVRKQTQCSFLEQAPSATASTFAHSIHEEPSYQARTSLPVPQSFESPHSFPTPTSLSEYNVTPTTTVPKKVFGLVELELIHHYSTQTYITITSKLTSHRIWRDIIFREALRHSFLLDALMATSALHKASYQPETSDAHAEYSRRALAFQNAALAGYIPALSSPTKDNSIALFAISCLLSVWSFGSKQLPDGLSTGKLSLSPKQSTRLRPDDASSKDDFVDFASVISLLQVIQGVHAVMVQTREWLLEELNELLHPPKEEDLPPNTPDFTAAIQGLEQRIQQICGAASGNLGAPNEIYELYSERLQSLHRVGRCRTVLECDMHIFSWPVTVKPLYMDLLRQHDPIALALFIYWAACFRAVEHMWWARGWPYKLIKDVSMFLDESWSDILAWPRQAVGLQYQRPADRVKGEDDG